MPRRKTSSSANKLSNGRGRGHGENYKPFLYTREVPSLGKADRIKGWKTGRVHHLLSTLESNYFYVLEWSPYIIDIREQFPLPLEATQNIAERLSIRHPTNPKTKIPEVVTTDFLIDIDIAGSTVLKARSTKYSKDLSDLRTLEKLEIERTYWHERGTDWGIATELDVPKALASNVEWIHTARDPDDAPDLAKDHLSFLITELTSQMISMPTTSLAKVCMAVDIQMGLGGGTCLWVAKHLIATRQWQVDMTIRISPDKTLKFVQSVVPTLTKGSKNG